jgi:hypothetical protein
MPEKMNKKMQNQENRRKYKILGKKRTNFQSALVWPSVWLSIQSTDRYLLELTGS